MCGWIIQFIRFFAGLARQKRGMLSLSVCVSVIMSVHNFVTNDKLDWPFDQGTISLLGRENDPFQTRISSSCFGDDLITDLECHSFILLLHRHTKLLLDVHYFSRTGMECFLKY